MKKYLLLFILFPVIFLTGCSLTEPPSGHIYAEAADDSNGVNGEDVTFSLELYQDYRITGDFNSTEDVDIYYVNLPENIYSLNFRVAHNGEEVKDALVTEVNTFPLNVSFIDGQGASVGTIHVGAASGNDIEVPKNAVKVIIRVYAQDKLLLIGTPLPYTSGSYFVQFYVS